MEDRYKKGREVYSRLRKLDLLKGVRFTSIEAGDGGDLFRILVATILSQNTNDKNSIEAYRRLDHTIGVDLDKLEKADIDIIIDAIKPAGLYVSKAKTIKSVIKLVKELDGLENLKRYDYEKARKILTSIGGIGLKTADILLLHLNYPAFPVDTHIKRVTYRLGFTDKYDYEEISNFWRKALDKNEYLDAHLRIISFGRKICKSKKPLCNLCPLRDICLYISVKKSL